METFFFFFFFFFFHYLICVQRPAQNIQALSKDRENQPQLLRKKKKKKKEKWYKDIKGVLHRKPKIGIVLFQSYQHFFFNILCILK